ncbi:MAG: coenzyme F420-0:L-glutamate ligase [Caldilineaceae bacterium]|nr:coenzyme F420-0:L-glutamate ligase [Caldilineaceae bacterium]
MRAMTLFPVQHLPLIHPGDDLAALIAAHLTAQGERLQPGDILVLAQKIVSKAEGRLVRLSEVTPGAQAEELARLVDKDPRHVQAILDDSRAIIRTRKGLLVVEQRSGWICANAGVDRSNVAPGEEELIALLPEDADASAARLRARLGELTGVEPGVIINDSHGRAWRIGTTGVAIGCAGLPPVWNQRGLHDLFGYELMSSEECIADELAGAAGLLMGQSDEGRPAVVIRGYMPPPLPPAPATAIQRPAQMDAFR